MSKIFIQTETLTLIANAIRNKNGERNKMTPSQMIEAINNLPIGAGKEMITLTFSVNWDNSINPSVSIPTSVIFNLYADEAYKQQITLTSAQNWTTSISTEKFGNEALINYSILPSSEIPNFRSPSIQNQNNHFTIQYTALASKPTYNDVFANNSWSQIIEACQTNSIPSTWRPGNSKSMLINGINYDIEIIGKNHDTYQNGGTAPLTFMFKNCIQKSQWHNITSYYGEDAWESCDMRNKVLPDILSKMPSEVKNSIQAVSKITARGENSGLATTNDKLFLLAEKEIFSNAGYANDGYSNNDETAALKTYSYITKRKKETDSGSTFITWWTRSPVKGQSYSICNVDYSGGGMNLMQNTSFIGVAPAFCF